MNEVVKKKSTYQKLKAANKMLAEEIRILVFEPESSAATIIKMRTKLNRDIENANWAGDSTKEKP